MRLMMRLFLFLILFISVRADARGQLNTKFTFVDTVNHIDGTVTHPTIEGSLIGNIDFNTGVVQYSISFHKPSGAPGACSYVAVSATASVVFSPRKSDIGRVKVSLDIQGWDKLMSHVSVTIH